MLRPRSRPFRDWDVRPIWIGLAALIVVAAVVEAVFLFWVIDDQRSIGADLRFFQGVAQRWLDTGIYYTERQLSGPFVVETLVDNLYPPHALFLFVPFVFLPAFLWWAIPIGLIGYVIWWCRPAAWALPILALVLLYPKTLAVIFYGNSDIWATAFAAAGVRWCWPAVLVLFKPSVGFLAAIGIGTRQWWIAFAILAIVNLPFLGLWLDYPRVLLNSDTDIGRALSDLPLFMLPVAAWLVSTRRDGVPLRAWAMKLLRRDSPAAMLTDRFAILAIFILSGAAALIDEIVWSRQLVLVFGNTTQAVSAILTGFFGGMALGSVVGGRIADRIRSPLRMYGFLELALVFVVLLTPISFRSIDDLYRGIYPALEGSPQVLALVRVALAVLALAPATVMMMGATLPTLTRYLARNAELSSAFSRLYAANTIGAIVGTAVAGFVLIEILGLSGALAVGAGARRLRGWPPCGWLEE